MERDRTEWPRAEKLDVRKLGDCRHPAPPRPHHVPFVDDIDRVLLPSTTAGLEQFLAAKRTPASFEKAGPRSKIFFDPAELGCGILTCGGLCPGLNNVIRSIVLQLTYGYGVGRIYGFRYGYAGLAWPDKHEPVQLKPSMVEGLHRKGGTFLGSSRGPQDLGRMVDTLEWLRIGILFVIGGDGGLKGASALADEITRRKLPIGVIGLPKTIDNDLQWTSRSFGFDTAVEAASKDIVSAHVEAKGAYNGVCVVKLMGRHSGFIAAHATLSTGDVNYCLVPEVPFALEGEGGFLQSLERRLEAKRHAVVVVAEGAGQELVCGPGEQKKDASGNLRLGDIGVFLQDRIKAYFADRGREVPVRYIDPSYTIRSLPANSTDSQVCLVLGQHAVHAGMAGRTDLVVGLWNQRFTHVPIPLMVGGRRQIDPRAELWQRVLETTGQPVSMV
jgi:6-phosphofructokinase 1